MKAWQHRARIAAGVVAVALWGWGCAGAAPVARLEVPVAAPPAPEPALAPPRCEPAPGAAEAWSARWRELKAERARHPAGWMLRQEDIALVLEGVTDPKRRASLQRLYDNRLGTPVFLFDGELDEAHAHHGEAHDEGGIMDAWAERRAVLDALIEAPLSARDLARLCGSSVEGFEVERLTTESLSALPALDAAVDAARPLAARVDAALVLGTWAALDEVDALDEGVKQVARGAFDASRHEGLDAEALTRAVWAVLRYDSDRRPFEVVGPLIRKAVVAAQSANIDPFVLVTLLFMESRFRPDAVGDGGLACGMAQQHSEYSMLWPVSDAKQQFLNMRVEDAKLQKQRQYECERLKDPDYALKVLVFVLNIIRSRAPDLSESVCRYNEGPYAPCKGRGLYYLKAHKWWRETIRVTYLRVLEKMQAPPGEGEGEGVGEIQVKTASSEREGGRKR